MTMLFILFAMPACSDKQSAEEQAKQEIEEAGEAVSNLIKKERDQLAMDLDSMRNDVNRKIEALRKEIDAAKSDTKEAISKEMTMLNQKAQELGNYLDEIADVSEKSWNNWKEKAESMLEDLEAKL